MSPRANAPTATRMVQSRERATQAYLLKLGGASSRAVAKALGISQAGALKAISRGLKAAIESDRVTVAEQRALHIHRTERWLVSMSKALEDGDPVAIRTALALMERQANLLGLDVLTSVQLRKLDAEVRVLELEAGAANAVPQTVVFGTPPAVDREPSEAMQAAMRECGVPVPGDPGKKP